MSFNTMPVMEDTFDALLGQIGCVEASDLGSLALADTEVDTDFFEDAINSLPPRHDQATAFGSSTGSLAPTAFASVIKA